MTDHILGRAKYELDSIEDGKQDGIVIVLKGHLLIEEMLRGKLAERLPNPQYITRANLGFYQLLYMVRAAFHADELKQSSIEGLDVWAAVETWNTLRNRLAHRLDHPDVQLLLKRIIVWSPDWPHDLQTQETQNNLSVMLGALLASLSGLGESDRARAGDR